MLHDDAERWQRGERTNFEGKAIRNRVLLLLADRELEFLCPLLSFQAFPHHARLHEAGAELEYVHFLNRGLVSVMAATKLGRTVEVATVGQEGIVGTEALAGLKHSRDRAIVQVAGDGFRIRVPDLQSALASNPRAQAAFTRYALIQGMQSAQLAACNRLHGVEQRLARWLLVAQDRVEQHFLQITHAELATILGTDRPSVSLAASALQRKGAIEYKRGTVKMVNRKLLEETSCECYAALGQLDVLSKL